MSGGHKMETSMQSNVVPLTGPNWASPDLTLTGHAVPAPEFPREVLGDWVQWCADTADSANAPFDYVAASLITASASLIGNARRAAFEGWEEPPILWTALVGSPSAKKSPAMAPIKRAIGHLEDELAAGHDPEEGPQPQLRIGDVTAQAAAEVASQNERGLLLQLDELSGWLNQNKRSGGEAMFLEAFGGGAYSVNRKGKPPLFIRHLSISVLGTIQPDPLAEVLGAKTERGFGARFLYVFPEPVRGFKRPKLVDNEAAVAALRRLRDLSLADGKPQVCPLSSEAKEAAEEWLAGHIGETERAHGNWEQWLGKQNGAVLRYGLVLEHMWWCIGDPDAPPPTEVSAEAICAAGHFIDAYSKPMAARCFGAASRPVPEQRAAFLIRLLQRQGLAEFNAREVRRGTAAGPVGALADAKVMKETCRLLAAASLIKKVGVRSGDTKGRAPDTYLVNPVLFSDEGRSSEVAQ
jgi:hypothetical protein